MRVPVAGCQAESSPESSGESRRQAGLESAVMPVAPTEAPRLDERLQVPRGDADGVQERALCARASPRAASRYTLAVQTPRCAATARTDSSPSRPPGSRPSASAFLQQGCSNNSGGGATGVHSCGIRRRSHL